MKTNVSRMQPRRVRAASRIPVSPWQEDSQNILIRADGVELTDQLRAAVSRKIGRARRKIHFHFYPSFSQRLPSVFFGIL